MVLLGIAWYYMVLHGIQWYYMHGTQWSVLHGIQWYCIMECVTVCQDMSSQPRQLQDIDSVVILIGVVYASCAKTTIKFFHMIH